MEENLQSTNYMYILISAILAIVPAFLLVWYYYK